MKRIPPVLALLFLTASPVISQSLQGRFVTSAYTWEQQDTVGSSSNHLFGYQTAQLALTKDDFTLGTYLQAWNDFAGPVKNHGKIRLYNLYFKWRNIGEVGDITIGRQAVFAGVGNGTIDGVNVSGRFLQNRLKVVGYVGPLAPNTLGAQKTSGLFDNAMYGGQVLVRPIDQGQISVSYMRREITPQAYTAQRYDPIADRSYLTEIKPSGNVDELVSVDLSGEYKMVYGYVRYDHDIKQEAMSRFQFFTRIKPIERIGVTGEYLQREPRISYNSIFSVFTYNSLKEFELGLEYEPHFLTDIQAFGKYGQVSFGEEVSKHFTIGLNWKYVSASVSNTFGYNGKIEAASLNAGYPLLDNMLTPTASFTYGRYKLSRYQTERDIVLSGAVGAVYRPFPVFSFDAQIQWIQNKIYSNDMRLYLRASYLLNERLNLF